MQAYKKMDTRAIIKRFIKEYIIKQEGAKDISDDTSLLDEGIIDSVGVMELVAFLQDTFDLYVEDEELVPEYLDSIGQLVSYVQSKTGDKQV
jgi:acyl carrier protein